VANYACPISFFVWLIALLCVQGGKYYEQKLFAASAAEQEGKARCSLFVDTETTANTTAGAHKQWDMPQNPITKTTNGDGKEVEQRVDASDEVPVDEASQTPPLKEHDCRRDIMNKHTKHQHRMTYFWQTSHFSRLVSADSESEDGKNPHEVYREIVEIDDFDANTTCLHKVFYYLPFQSFWMLFVFNLKGMKPYLCCCGSADPDMTVAKKMWVGFLNFIRCIINLACVFLAIVAMAASMQAATSKSKLPFVHSIYRGINEGEVCAYNSKCGDIQTFDSKEVAHQSGYRIVHCGKCSDCSTWQDLSVQWTTRKKAAKLAQSCGLRNLGNKQGMAKCLSKDMGWTTNCSWAWVHSIECTKQ